MEDNSTLDNKTSKRKLSREELLAGKCLPEEEEDDSADPRFKSPDEILLQMVAQRRSGTPSEVTIQHGYRRGETTLGPDESVSRLPALETLMKNLDDLSERYENDKKRWREYEHRIIQWKSQVMTVIQNLQNQANDDEPLKKEVEELKERNRQKDEEIRSLGEQIKKLTKDKKH